VARGTEPVVGHVDLEAEARAERADDPTEVISTVDPLRLLAEPPSVASPAGSSAGSTTSAIADPHRSGSSGITAIPAADAANPRVAGVAPSPAKRYRPGAPPASPHIGARALPAATGPAITPIAPWYRRLAPWTAIVAVATAVAVVLIVVVSSGGSNDSSGKLDARPPANAPSGTKIMSSPQFGIAVPDSWIVGSDPGTTFGQLRQQAWGEPRVATNSKGPETIVVTHLDKIAHDPLTDPDLFWSDQVVDAGNGRTVSASTSYGVHGLRGNYVVVNDRSGSLVTVAVETDRGVYLLGFRSDSDSAAKDLFERYVQTFDVR
jgi:hypothetical protein